MSTAGWVMGVVVGVGMSVAALVSPTQTPQSTFTLLEFVPQDVFLCVAQRHNPERKFLDDYWSEVFAALEQSGVGQDVLDLIGSLLGAGPAAEIERLREQAERLLAGVEWQQLAGREMVFAEKFVFPAASGGSNASFTMPEMVWLFRGSPEGAERNYAGLLAILEALAKEINGFADSDKLTVTRTEQVGAQVASLNLLGLIGGAPKLPLSVARHEDVIVIALREDLFGDVLALLGAKSTKHPLSTDPRFKDAFAALPPAEDGLTFFDLHAMLDPLRSMLCLALDAAQAPGDIYRNASFTAADNRLNTAALAAYHRGDYKAALELTEKLYESAPKNSIVLYNLACFNALVGNREVALEWLAKAVDGGFHAPTKIATDTDLVSLRDDPRYEAALARATELAGAQQAEDIVLNSAKTGESYVLNMQASQAYEAKNYQQGLELAEQAYAVAPKDARVLYSLARFHALLGHRDQALEFLTRAVDGGFYCPRHISKDPDLDSLRDDPRYAAACDAARANAARVASRKSGEQIAWVKLAVEKLADAVGIIDHIAAVEHTDGHAVWLESLATLIPDAKTKPVYPLLAGKAALKEFDRFLPQETVSFSVSNGLDPGALADFLERSVRELGPPGEELLAKWAEFQKQIGVNLRKDVLAWIEGGFSSVELADQRGSVWLLKVKDEETARTKVGAAIEFVSTKLPEFIGQNPSLAPLALMSSLSTSPVSRDDLQGFHNIHLAMLPQPAVWGVADNHLVIASSAEAAALCLATARGAHPGIRKNPRVMAEALLPDGPFEEISLTDERELGEGIAKGLGIVSMVSGMIGSFMPDQQLRGVFAKVSGIVNKLTPVARKIDFYKSTATLTTFDGQRWRTRSVTHYFSPAERAAKGTTQAGAGTAPAR